MLLNLFSNMRTNELQGTREGEHNNYVLNKIWPDDVN